MSYSNFTSLPPEEEQQFVVFERRTVEESKRAMTLGWISGGVVGLILIVLYFTSDPPKTLHADALESDIPAEEEKRQPATAPTPDTTADDEDEGEAEGAEGAEGEADEAATDEGATGDGSEEGTPAEAPPPPKGATKAPPTDLVK